MAKGKPIHRRRQSKPTAKQISPILKDLAREANATLGTKFNTRKKALSRHAVAKLETLRDQGVLTSKVAVKRGSMHGPAAPQKFVGLPLPAGKSAKIGERRKAGYPIVGRSQLVPNKPDLIERMQREIAEGRVSGVVPLPGGRGIEEISLPLHNIKSMRSFIKALENGEADRFKDHDEYFAFRIFGHMSQRKPFRDAAELAEWLRHYKPIYDQKDGDLESGSTLADTFENFTLFRLIDYPWNYEYDRMNRPRAKTQQDRRTKAKRAREKAEKRRAQTEAERQAKRREKQPPEMRKARLEAQKHYQRAYRAELRKKK